ncbi:formylmethanofuran dehydrogenase subunit A [Rhodospirillaceae bacterium SYSU D60014]|uniref:formylmethanofuran dehydrogenase subunit A n=1 Tax=Virgifigura deserti TaxID=2268457 RepID=UPI000E66620F
MTLVKLAGGRIVDPANGRNGDAADLYLRDGVIVPDPGPGAAIDETVDITGKIVMAGAIDIHSHIGGGKINIARMMMIEDHRKHADAGDGLRRSGGGLYTPTTFVTGYRYAAMGYTAAFEPAMVPANARHAHAELADTPMIDKGCYAMLGSDDFLLRMLANGAEQQAINDYVGWMLQATQSVALKVVNPGGINAFKFNARNLGLDTPSPHYGVTPRRIVAALARAVNELGICHPVHLHCNDLGVPGNWETTVGTIDAAEGLPLHLTHLQFHSYGTEGDRKFSSAAAQLAEVINRTPSVSVDIGQIIFGQTVTASGDTMIQYRNHRHAHPKKWMCMDIECDAGCGVVPFRYRDENFVNALQWAIGLELLLLVEDPWRVFLTTDHPNGAPFTVYPHLIRLLMDRGFRRDMLKTINKHAAAASTLGGIEREYSLYEIAILTRAAPARSLGLLDRGHLGVGAVADITVYTERENREAMFARPDYVFKDGRLIARNGEVTDIVWGATHVVRPEFDQGIEGPLEDYFNRFQTVRLGNFRVTDDEMEDEGRSRLVRHPCRRTTP